MPKRSHIVAKLEWKRSSKKDLAKGTLGTLKVTVEKDGKLYRSVQGLKVQGRIWHEPDREYAGRMMHPHGDDGPGGGAPSLDGTYRATGVTPPRGSRNALMLIVELDPQAKLLKALKAIVRGKTDETLPKVHRTTVTLQDATGGKEQRLKKEAKKQKAKRQAQARARTRRGPGRHPRKKIDPWEAMIARLRDQPSEEEE